MEVIGNEMPLQSIPYIILFMEKIYLPQKTILLRRHIMFVFTAFLGDFVLLWATGLGICLGTGQTKNTLENWKTNEFFFDQCNKY